MSTKQRLLDITYQLKLSHLSSCLSSLPIIEEIYSLKKEDEVFILSNGHAGLALYCVLESKYGIDAVDLLNKHGIHPSKDLKNKLYCSTGSLGCGLPIAVGHALADRGRSVWCLISDGECAEGSIWESLAFIKNHSLDNLRVYVNINGVSAYDNVDTDYLINRLQTFLPSINIRLSDIPNYGFASGILAHYYVLKEEDYKNL